MSQDILSSHIENAELFRSVLGSVCAHIKRGFFLRKWARNSDIILKPTKKLKPYQEE